MLDKKDLLNVRGTIRVSIIDEFETCLKKKTLQSKELQEFFMKLIQDYRLKNYAN